MGTASLSASETNGESVLSQSFSTAWRNFLEKKGSGLTFPIRGIAPGPGFMEAHLKHIGRREDSRDYFEGEEI